MSDTSQLERLLGIMARLRDPQDGCDWDLAQDFGTIAPYTIEEEEIDGEGGSGPQHRLIVRLGPKELGQFESFDLV